MKFDKFALPAAVLHTLALAAFITLAGCAGAPAKTTNSDEAQPPPQLLSTREYLPMRRYAPDQTVVPYVATPNPYLSLQGRIDKDAVTGFIAARKALKNNQLKEADQRLEQVIAADPTLAGPWVLRGDIAVQNNDPTTALAHYRKALSVNKFNVNAYLPLAKLLREQGDFIAAQNVYAQALGVWKDFPEAHLNLGVLYDIYLNDPLQAQQHMEAYQFLQGTDEPTVARWLEELRARTGIAPNLYIGPSNTSQISKQGEDNSDS